MRRQYPKQYKDSFKTLRQWREKIIAQFDLYTELEVFEKECKAYKKNILLNIDFMGNLEFSVHGAKRFADSIPYLKWFYEKGYRQKLKPELYIENKRIKYYMGKDDHIIGFYLFLGHESSCKLTIVGEETVKVPKYKLVCP